MPLEAITSLPLEPIPNLSSEAIPKPSGISYIIGTVTRKGDTYCRSGRGPLLEDRVSMTLGWKGLSRTLRGYHCDKETTGGNIIVEARQKNRSRVV